MRDYDQVFQEYAEVRAGHDDIQRLLQASIPVSSGHCHLDVGCGPCTETTFLAGSCARFVGLDRSLSLLKIASARCPSGVFVVADCETALPLSSACADSVTMVASVHHFKDLAGLLRRVHPVIKPGGRTACRYELA